MKGPLLFFVVAALVLPSAAPADPSAAEIQLEAKIERLAAQKRAAIEREAEQYAAAQRSYQSARAEIEASIVQTTQELDAHVNPNSPRPCSYQQKLKTGRPATAYEKSEHEDHIRQLQAKLAQLHRNENALVVPQHGSTSGASIDAEIAAARTQLTQARKNRDAEEALRGATYVASTIFGAPASKRAQSSTAPLVPAHENPFPAIDRNPLLSSTPDVTIYTELPTPPHRTAAPPTAEPVADPTMPLDRSVGRAPLPTGQELVDRGAIRLKSWDFDPAAGTPIPRAIPTTSSPIIDNLNYQYESTKPPDLYDFVANAPLGSAATTPAPAADNPEEFRSWVAGAPPKAVSEAKPNDAANAASPLPPSSPPAERK